MAVGIQLTRCRMCIGVGTPTRIVDLLDTGTNGWNATLKIRLSRVDYHVLMTCPGALSSDNLERIVVDFSHIDQKKRGILDMRETQQAMMLLLNRSEFKARYEASSRRLELLFF